MSSLLLKTGAAWALHDLAKGGLQNRTGNLVWQTEGVSPLVAMLAHADSPQAIAAASAIGQLATPTCKAFQVTRVNSVYKVPSSFSACGLGRLLLPPTLAVARVFHLTMF